MPKARRSTNARQAPTASSAWAFREPIATLLADGKTIGRHYAGPNWEHSDGSAVVGKAVGNAPGATPNDIPWLKLEVISQRGSGVLTGVTTVQRINTTGGKLDGACDKAGTFRARPTPPITCSCARGEPARTTAVIPGLCDVSSQHRGS